MTYFVLKDKKKTPEVVKLLSEHLPLQSMAISKEDNEYLQQSKALNENDIEFGRLKQDYNIVKQDDKSNYSIDISHIKRIKKENDS